MATRSLDVPNRADLQKKWRPNYLGPLRVLEVMGPITYHIELSPSMKMAHNHFHIFKLKCYHRSDDFDGFPPIVVDADGSTEFEVEAILGKKRERGKLFYLIQFKSDPSEEAVWLPSTERSNCKDLLREYK